jgi:predicted DNA-binding ribbon-helix-helix protein
MKSLIVKRSVDIDGRKTRVSLEDAFATSDAVEGDHEDR